jgi:hypothetical protein
VILDLAFRRLYKKYKNIPKSWQSKKVIEVTERFGGLFSSPIFLTYLSRQPVKSYSIRKGMDVEAHERTQYENISDYPVKKASFEEHFDCFLKNNEEYQEFLTEMKKYENFCNQDFEHTTNISTLFKSYPAIRKYKGKFLEYIQRVAETKFKFNYKVKFMKRAPEFNDKGVRISTGELGDSYYNMQDFEEIFLVQFEGDEIQLNFKSNLGKMILHNMLILDTDWVGEEVCELKKNAYFIYKRFLLNSLSGKNKPEEIELWFDDIKRFLDLNGKNNGVNYSIIDRAFKEFQEKGLIKEYGFYKLYNNQRQYRLTFYPRPVKQKIKMML